ncbi:MAG: 4'-phosphopantetheinyl transferase superfamily protein [Pirellulaceae bacterium]
MIQLTTNSSLAPAGYDRLELASGQLHLWRISLNALPGQLPTMRESLSGDERQRAARFVADDHARRFVVAHSAMREILGRYLGLSARELRLETGQHGKPRLARAYKTSLSFNLSHSADLAVLAVAPGGEVGIDIEQVREIRSFPMMLERCLSRAERNDLGRMPAERRHAEFLRFWTHKEAYVKAFGVGLRQPMDGITVDLVAPPARKVVNHFGIFPDQGNVYLTDIHPGEGFVGAVAATSVDCSTVETFGWVGGLNAA